MAAKAQGGKSAAVALREAVLVPDPARDFASFEKARKAAAKCRACHLWKLGTQTVFGEGPVPASILMVGEQPGDKEDLEGRPFVGPAGTLLRKAMREAGVDPAKVYITNAVKHFKFIQRGKRRMHQKPAPPEINACIPWLQQELKFVQPQLIVLLGVTAVTGVFGKAGTIGALRGRIIPLSEGRAALVTVHPSSLLRAPDEASRRAGYQSFVKDLKIAAPYAVKRARKSA